MKPFNLERALAGDPVCTRDGLPATFGAYNKDALTYHQVIGWVDGRIDAWSIAGRYSEHRECPDDLVMAPHIFALQEQETTGQQSLPV